MHSMQSSSRIFFYLSKEIHALRVHVLRMILHAIQYYTSCFAFDFVHYYLNQRWKTEKHN